MKCPKCGNELVPGAKFCGKCGTTVVTKTITPSLIRMPNGIALGEGEQIVKQYRIGRYTLRRGEVIVTVTNKRVIRYELSSFLGLQNNVIEDVNIDVVNGTTTEVKRSLSILGLSVATVLLVLGILMIVWSFGSIRFSPLLFIGGFVSLGITGISVFKSIQPTMYFTLQTALGSRTLETSVNDRGRFMRFGKTGAIFQFKPTPETVIMLQEIGAMIYDLKTLGDTAIEKWNSSTETFRY